MKKQNRTRGLVSYQSLLRFSGTSIIHSGNISWLANHLRASGPLRLEAWRMLKLLASDSCPAVSTSGMGSDSVSGSTSGEDDDWRDITEEARFRARCWASERCWDWRRSERSLRFCWSEIGRRLKGRRRSCGAILGGRKLYRHAVPSSNPVDETKPVWFGIYKLFFFFGQLSHLKLDQMEADKRILLNVPSSDRIWSILEKI